MSRQTFKTAVTQAELENAPEKVQELVKSLRADLTEFIETTDEAIDLATEYITEKVVGPTSYADCSHIAFCINTTQAINLFYKQVELNNGLPFELRVPNSTTIKTLQDSESGKHIVECKNAEDMFNKLGI